MFNLDNSWGLFFLGCLPRLFLQILVQIRYSSKSPVPPSGCTGVLGESGARTEVQLGESVLPSLFSYMEESGNFSILSILVCVGHSILSLLEAQLDCSLVFIFLCMPEYLIFVYVAHINNSKHIYFFAWQL
jgi:hypothetical protein